MNDLDHLIDEAARQIAQQEPSDALSVAVMERVAERETPFTQRWLAWGSVAAAVALAGVVFVVGNRTAEKAQSVERAQGSGLKAQGAPTMPEPVVNQPAQVSRAAVVASRQEPVDEMGQVADPIIVESIASEPIAVERLEVTALTTLHSIEIAPIAIPPISASDD